jgi:hypothetical protein
MFVVPKPSVDVEHLLLCATAKQAACMIVHGESWLDVI